MNKFCGGNEVFNFSPPSNEGQISIDIDTAFKLLTNKLEGIKSAQSHPHLSEVSELISGKNALHLKKMEFSEHEICDVVNNHEAYLLSIKQYSESEQREINLISKRLHELTMLMNLQKQINIMQSYYLQAVMSENKNLFLFHARTDKTPNSHPNSS